MYRRVRLMRTQHRSDDRLRMLIEGDDSYRLGTTDLLFMRLCSELSQRKGNPRRLQNRGRSFHMVYSGVITVSLDRPGSVVVHSQSGHLRSRVRSGFARERLRRVLLAGASGTIPTRLTIP